MQISLSELVEALQENRGGSLSACPFDVGKQYLLRTIGYHWLGRVKLIVGKFLILEEASWVADTGRYSEALSGKIGELQSSELEPSPRPVIVNVDHVTDAVEYPFQIPRGVK